MFYTLLSRDFDVLEHFFPRGNLVQEGINIYWMPTHIPDVRGLGTFTCIISFSSLRTVTYDMLTE